MSKYEALGQFLLKQTNSLVPMTFKEIERIVGHKLPQSQRYPAWWSNNPSNNPMTQVWLDAGFNTEQVDIGGGKLVFRRIARSTASESRTDLHPLIGCMAGTVTIAPGVDLTEPDPDWADYIDRAYGSGAS